MVAVVLMLSWGCGPPSPSVATVENEEWTTLEGQQVSLGSLMGEKGTVFLTMDPDCPITRLYTHAFQDIADEFGPEGIRVVGLYPGPFLERSEAKHFSEAADLHFPQVMDNDCVLSLALQARVTPECFLTDATGRVVYRGALDDRPVRQGRKKPQATKRYLADAVSEFLRTGKPQPTVVAVGCIVECND